MWVLIVITLSTGMNGPTNIAVQEFKSEQRCQVAGERINKLSPVKWLCTEK